MPSHHDIRLKGPWSYCLPNRHEPFNCTLPVDLAGFQNHLGYRIALRRNFHRPSGLTPADSVRLRFRADVSPDSVRLNDGVLSGEHSSGIWLSENFVERLDFFNRIEIEFLLEEPVPASGLLCDDAVLRLESSAA